MKVSVIVPSRLQPNPVSQNGNLYLDRALMQIRRQTAQPFEVIVALDRGMAAHLPERFADLKVVESDGSGQALAVNAGVRNSTGHLVAFCEDDDYWEPERLATMLPWAGDFTFVTSNQREIDEIGSFVRYNDFPTPSGWLLRRSLWDSVGGFDETFKYHVDTDFLGKARCLGGASRLHIVEHGGANAPHPGRQPWLAAVRQFSAIWETSYREPLVARAVNREGGMARIASDPQAAAQSRFEHARMLDRYGGIPW